MTPGTTIPARYGPAVPAAAAPAAAVAAPSPYRLRERFRPRPRLDLGAAESYTRLVSQLKVLLPAGALLIIAAVFFFSSVNSGRNAIALTFDRIEDAANDRRMLNPKLTGVDGEGRPFLVTASYAEQAKARPDLVTLVKVDADITLKDGQWLLVTAQRGLLDGEAQTLDLGGGINLYSGTGYEMRTDSARILIDKGQITGNAPVVGQGPLGVITANGFDVDREAKTVLFRGGVESVYMPPPRKAANETASAGETTP